MALPDAIKRLVDLMHLFNIPVVQTVEQVGPTFVGCLVEPISVLLDLFLFPADMVQCRDELLAALSQLVHVSADSDFFHHHASFSVYPPSQKATGVNPWMNARWVPSVALAPGLRSRTDCFGGVGKEGALRRVPPYEACGKVPRP